MEYWKECISEAIDEAGITATDKQINIVASWVEGAHENYSLANGYDCIQSPVESRAEQKLKELQLENEKRDEWIRTTKPCKYCLTTGIVQDGWNRDVECMNCRGKGRV